MSIGYNNTILIFRLKNLIQDISTQLAFIHSIIQSRVFNNSSGANYTFIYPSIHSSFHPSFHPFRPSSHICKLARVFCKIRFSWPLLKVLGFLKSFKIFGGLNHSIISCAYCSQLIFKISCFKLKIQKKKDISSSVYSTII